MLPLKMTLVTKRLEKNRALAHRGRDMVSHNPQAAPGPSSHLKNSTHQLSKY